MLADSEHDVLRRVVPVRTAQSLTNLVEPTAQQPAMAVEAVGVARVLNHPLADPPIYPLVELRDNLEAALASRREPGSGTYFAVQADPRVGRHVGRYRLVGVLGRGGMGTVYEAYDELAGRCVALKLLPEDMTANPKALRRFIAGAQAAARLEHRNIVGVYEADLRDGVCFVAMPLVRGPTAQELLHKYGRIAWGAATRLMAAVICGVRAAHAVGVIHRDIKPSNILIGRDGIPRLADFGLARLSSVPGSTTGQALVGTIAYMSPEQCRGRRADARSDIYSLGATYYRLLTGQSPYSGHAWNVIHSHCTAPIPDPCTLVPSLPAACREIIARAMAKAPEGRYQTTAAMLAEVAELASQAIVRAEPAE